MNRYPLLFSYRDLIAGDGFFASVAVYGRALLEEDAEGAWMYGINPGGLAGGGETRKEALSDFRRGYSSVLLDIAHSAAGFEELKSQTEDFFNTSNDVLEESWRKAVDEVRSGKLDTDWLKKHPFSDEQIFIRVARVEKPVAEDYSVPQEELAA